LPVYGQPAFHEVGHVLLPLEAYEVFVTCPRDVIERLAEIMTAKSFPTFYACGEIEP
jgi:hypothetical protein